MPRLVARPRRHAVLALCGLCSIAALFSTAAAQGQERPKIGVALAGGGAKGCAHVGVLEALEELEVPVDFVAGTSMGAVIGGLYASGMTTAEISEALVTTDWDDLLVDEPARRDLIFRRKADELRYLLDLEIGVKKGRFVVPSGLRSGQKLGFLLRALTLPAVETRDFDQLPIPFRAVAANVADGSQVVLGEGDLATAIRASMAIPGVFSAVERDGLLLVDGGVVNNVPVDVVRAMGADVVIAVDVGAPLDAAEVKGSLFSILGQTLGMLTRKNMQPRLADADLVIRPPVGGFKTLQFDAAEEIITRGREQANAQAQALERYALTASAYAAHRAARPPRGRLPEVVDAIRFEGNERVDSRVVEAQIRTPVGGPLDFAALAADIGRLYGLGDFEQVSFALDEGAEGTAVVFELEEKPWGPDYLQLGLGLDSDFDGESSVELLVNFTMTRLNALGGEWRNDLQLGRELRLSTELFQPLDFREGWFLAPSLDYRRQRPGFFADGRELAQLEVRRTTAALDLGYQFNRYGEVRLGVERGQADVGVETGSLPPGVVDGIELDDIDVAGLSLEATLDRLDQAAIPRSGTFARLRIFDTQEALGADDDFTRVELLASAFGGPGRHTVFGSLEGGWSPGGELPVYAELTLGGLLSLSGFAEDELRGQVAAVARGGYYYQLAQKLYLGGWLEAGNAWTSSDAASLDDLVYTTTAALVLDTFLGPLTFAWGQAESGNAKLYLVVGRRF